MYGNILRELTGQYKGGPDDCPLFIDFERYVYERKEEGGQVEPLECSRCKAQFRINDDGVFYCLCRCCIGE